MEMVEVIDDNSNVVGIVPRDEVVEKNLKHRAAFVIVVNSKRQVYVSQRKRTKKTCPLGWIIGAGGAVNAGEDFETAAHRELKEELGFDCKISFLFDFGYKSDINNYKAKVYLAEYNGKVKLDSRESEQGKWASIGELKMMIQKKLLCPDTSLYAARFLESWAK